jgi:Ca2+-binding RTX toxin-like protein
VALGTLRVRALDVDAFESITIGYHSSLHFTEATTFDGHNLVGSHFKLAGSDENDRLDLSATAARVEIDGGDGNDQLLAGSGNASIAGGNGDDEITGGIGKDNLNGSSGNDTVDGGGGNDLIIAEIGNDWVNGGDGNDKISGTVIYDHTNHPIKTSGDKMFDGGAGNDLFENLDGLGDFRATLVGGQGNDTLQFHGDASNLSVEGIETLELTLKIDRNDFEEHLPIKASGEFLESLEHISSDRRVGSVAAQIELTSSEFHWRDQHSSLFGDIYGTSHADEIDMSKARKYWTITSGNGDDVLTAGSAGAEFYAGNGDDKIVGGKGGDEINDGAGNDIIDGRGGKDTFYEQDGANTFIFEAGSGTDYLYGFDTAGNGKDKIDLAAVKSISSYSDLIAHHVDEKFGGLYIEFSDKDRVWLDGFSKEMLDSSMFIF